MPPTQKRVFWGLKKSKNLVNRINNISSTVALVKYCLISARFKSSNQWINRKLKKYSVLTIYVVVKASNF